MASETGTILHFPRGLRSAADEGKSHVRFGIKNFDGAAAECSAIHLFVPQGFSVPDSAGYGTMDLGLIQGFRNREETTQADAVANLARAGAIADANVPGAMGAGAAVGGATALEQGIAINPYTDTTFTNTNIRSFGFTFKLVSETREEAQMAAMIENVFRKYLYPEKAGSVSLRYPAKFTIDFYNGGDKNKYMPKIMESYLVNCTTTYNSTTNAFHEDGQPVEVDMALTFQETRPLTRADLYKEEVLDNNISYAGDYQAIRAQKREEDE